eukprot:1195894-Prorocentrum_minimum.AAC.7
MLEAFEDWKLVRALRCHCKSLLMLTTVTRKALGFVLNPTLRAHTLMGSAPKSGNNLTDIIGYIDQSCSASLCHPTDPPALPPLRAALYLYTVKKLTIVHAVVRGAL